MSPREQIPHGSLGMGTSNLTCSEQAENGFMDSVLPLDSELTMQEFYQQPPIKGVDDHLIEFSEALRTVAKALRRMAEGKATAQAEATEWKRKYEQERAYNLQRNHNELPLESGHCDGKIERLKNLSTESVLPNSSNEVTERCGGRDGLCSHDGHCKGEWPNNLSSEAVLHNPGNQQPERCCGMDGICSHDVLRDEAIDSDSQAVRNIVMRKASFKLSWGCKGEKSGQHKHDIVSFERGNITTAERSSRQISLKWESHPQTVLVLTKPNSVSVRILCAEMIRWLRDIKKMDIFVEPRVKTELLTESSYFSFVQTWEHDDEISFLHTKVDLVVTLGGDGTVLWAASMFKGPVPPVVPFSLGSLGFMTPFQSDYYRDYLNAIFRGPISITLRHRLQCHVIRDAAKDEVETDEPILVLNEVTIDRGISSFLTYLECYCDNSFVTSVQGDGLILSTTSGSTAYSLAAGGSMVHPQVPGILFTPICPHSLSFRPLILPEYVTLRVQVPFNSRGHAWASFDGKDRKQLAAGDALICSMAPWPVPTACQGDSTSDFLHSIHDGLHWNLRKTQSFDGPRET